MKVILRSLNLKIYKTKMGIGNNGPKMPNKFNCQAVALA